MAPKKGVSFDDKRLRLLEIFARAEVFTLKEIEKIGSKEKGIVEQTIKDVLQTLVDDALVETDKIGAGNFYWALPSKAGNSRRSQISKLQSGLDQGTKSTQARIALARVGKQVLAEERSLGEPTTGSRKIEHDRCDGYSVSNLNFIIELKTIVPVEHLVWRAGQVAADGCDKGGLP